MLNVCSLCASFRAGVLSSPYAVRPTLSSKETQDKTCTKNQEAYRIRAPPRGGLHIYEFSYWAACQHLRHYTCELSRRVECPPVRFYMGTHGTSMNPGLPRLHGNSHPKFVIMSIHGAPNGPVRLHRNLQIKWKQGTGYENITREGAVVPDVRVVGLEDLVARGHLESMLLVMLRDLSKNHVVPSKC